MMEDEKNIRDLIVDDKYLIILDTNILLEMYRFSPDYADFALDCLNQIKDSIRIPFTVYMEFNKHHASLYKRRQTSIASSIEDSLKLVQGQMNKTLSSCSVLKKRNFPEVDDLLADIKGKYESITKAMEDYFSEHSVLSLIKDNWTSDKPAELVRDLCQSGHVMIPFTQDQLYQICEDGEKRYKKDVPPGFKDAKAKDGIRKYSDLILWKEILRYSQVNRRNIIFVTNDVKIDWWNQDENGIVFKPELFAEFEKETKVRETSELGKQLKMAGKSLDSMTIIPYTADTFFPEMSRAFCLHTPDAIEAAVNLTAETYIENIQEKVFDKIFNDIAYSGTEYLDDSITQIGTEGIDSWEIDSVEYTGYSVEENEDGIASYLITYEVSMYGNSYDYWGRDDDTKEVILSGPYEHEVAGQVTVSVKRSVDFLVDFESDEDFDSVEIEAASFSEVKFVDNSVDDIDYEQVEGAYTTCPDCGKPINIYNDGGKGYCTNCAPNH